MSDRTPAVVIERHFDAPIETVWSMWTDADRFAAWYGPAGATIPVSKLDLRVGGERLVCMEMPTPDGTMTMWFAGEILAVDEPTRFVYTEALADADGNALSAEEAGMGPGHPAVTEVRVELTPAADGTDLVLTHVGIPADSPGAQGWAMALDKLAGTLS